MKEIPEPSFYLPTAIFDTHFHALQMMKSGLNAENLLEKAFRNGLIGALEVAINEEHFDKRLDFVSRFNRLGLSAGIHPSYVSSDASPWSSRFDIIKDQARNKHVWAIGETGLDFHRDFVSPQDQETAFRDHLALSAEVKKPVIIHNRSANQKIMNIVKKSLCRHGIFHCFSEDWNLAKKIIDLGFYISFSGNITYKKNDLIRDAASKIPADRLLVETDAPYLSPQNLRGQANHPGHIGYTLEALAKIRSTDVIELGIITRTNANNLLAIN